MRARGGILKCNGKEVIVEIRKMICALHQTVRRMQIKCQLDATEVFIADLIVCSTCFGHHYAHLQELKSFIQWLLPVVFRAVVFKLLVWCGAEGYVSGLHISCCGLQVAGLVWS